jgi:hypothetical protein
MGHGAPRANRHGCTALPTSLHSDENSDPPLRDQARPVGARLLGLRSREIDCRKAATEFGHAARPLEQTVRDTCRWFESEGMLERGQRACDP